ncbi:hypothetical protein [Persephonella sp.]|nr:hypothetical protein [Persephonella sp.]
MNYKRVFVDGNVISEYSEKAIEIMQKDKNFKDLENTLLLERK